MRAGVCFVAHFPREDVSVVSGLRRVVPAGNAKLTPRRCFLADCVANATMCESTVAKKSPDKEIDLGQCSTLVPQRKKPG
jgi:hypothetical protein